MVRSVPIEVFLSWPAPNYIDPERRGPGAVNVTIVFMSLVTTAVFSRLYIHLFIIKRFGPGDICIILAYLSTIAMMVLEIVAYERFDLGRHVWDIPFGGYSKLYYLAWWYKIVYSTASCFTRMALIFFYYRITQGGTSTKNVRIFVHLTATFSVAVGLLCVLVTVFLCTPIRAIWTLPAVPGARCYNDGWWTFVCGLLNTLADLLVVVLPIPIIYRLMIPLRKRLGAIVLVSLGFLVCIAGIVRAYFVWLSLIHSYDVTWNGYGTLVAATVEIHVGLLCACAPALRVGYIKLLNPKLKLLRASLSHHTSGSKHHTFGTKLSDIASTAKPPLQLQGLGRPFRANSGTFPADATRDDVTLNDAIRDSFKHDDDVSMESANHDLRVMDDLLSESEGWSPRLPHNNEIYMTREIRVESEPAYRTHRRDDALRHWSSTKTC